jgi:hypothetical protein
MNKNTNTTVSYFFEGAEYTIKPCPPDKWWIEMIIFVGGGSLRCALDDKTFDSLKEAQLFLDNYLKNIPKK